MSNPTLKQLPEKDTWLTPPEITDGLDKYLDVDLDPCAGRETTIGETNWSILRGEDGLERSWTGYDTVWVNPPFSEKTQWIEKAVQEYNSGNVERVLLLLTPDSTDVQSWFHGVGNSTGIVDHASYVWFSEGRTGFVEPEVGEKTGSPTFGTMISCFGEFPHQFLSWLSTEGWLVPNTEYGDC